MNHGTGELPLGLNGPRERLRALVAAAQAQGVWIGTSSWKYEGWSGQLYDRSRYVARGRFSKQRFERECLTEYAEVFPTVSVDAGYYRFPEERTVASLGDRVPPGFALTFKVTDQITVKRFPRVARSGPRAGEPNPDFLNADLFTAAFLRPLEAIRDRVGVLMFEFSRFSRAEFETGDAFVAQLDAFLGRLPAEWRYAIEVRTPALLESGYFAMLARHGVAHVFNSWTGMPPIEEQLALPGAFASPEFCVARLLLRPGRAYAEAVRLFSPVPARVQDPYPEGRAAAAGLMRRVAARGPSTPPKAFLYVNNRFEGNAIETILNLLTEAGIVPGRRSER